MVSCKIVNFVVASISKLKNGDIKMYTQTEREINAYWRYMTDVTVPMNIRLMSVNNFEEYLYLPKISSSMAVMYHLGKLITYMKL
jgi:hypothetical protein